MIANDKVKHRMHKIIEKHGLTTEDVTGFLDKPREERVAVLQSVIKRKKRHTFSESSVDMLTTIFQERLDKGRTHEDIAKEAGIEASRSRQVLSFGLRILRDVKKRAAQEIKPNSSEASM